MKPVLSDDEKILIELRKIIQVMDLHSRYLIKTTV